MRRSLRTHLSLTIALVALTSVFVASVCANAIIRRTFDGYIQLQQEKKIAGIVENLAIGYDRGAGEWNAGYVHGIGMNALYDGYVVKLYQLDGNMIWDAENHDMSLCRHMMTEIAARMEKERPGMAGGYETESHAVMQNGTQVGTVEIGHYGPYFLSEGDFDFLNDLNIALLVVGALSLALSVFTGAVLARWIARPIAKTAHIARRISGGNYGVRFEGKARIRELNELTDSINRLSDALEAQESLRKRLAVNVAHELRTPLSAVSAHLEMMIDGVWAPDAERLESCAEEIRRLTALAQDLGRLAEIEDESIKLSVTDVELSAFVGAAARRFEAEAQAKGITIAASGEEAHVSADPERLGQVLANLLSNAIKYTPACGQIRVEAGSDAKNAFFAVADNGIGIPKAELPFVFERFYRAEGSRNRKTGGAGIGLAIVKSIVQAHGGCVRAESEEGRGSVFTVTLPRVPQD